MKIVIPGGSGLLGRLLAAAFVEDGHEVVVLGRKPSDDTQAGRRTIAWDGVSLGDWAQELEGADVVINLAGRSVDCRYNARNRKEIIDSRVQSTRVLGAAVQQCERPPKVWLQASSATLYAHRYDAPNDEATGIIGGEEVGVPETWHFSVGVVKAWEQAFDEVEAPNTRKVKLRISIVMSPEGAFGILRNLTRLGLGGKNGDGRQFVSWIHERDFVRAVKLIIEREDLSGAINLASPNPLPNADFMRGLRKAAGMPIGLPAAKWMLEVATFFLRTETELVLKSRRVIPSRLLDAGFEFEHPRWDEAARALCGRA
jgi:uncharacterized protein (TIGR01777 family)